MLNRTFGGLTENRGAVSLGPRTTIKQLELAHVVKSKSSGWLRRHGHDCSGPDKIEEELLALSSWIGKLKLPGHFCFRLTTSAASSVACIQARLVNCAVNVPSVAIEGFFPSPISTPASI